MARTYRHLDLDQRRTLFRLAEAGTPVGEIARRLGRHPSTICRELGRDRFRVAGTAEFNGFNRDIRHDRIQPLVDWTREQFPRVDTDRVVAWSGLRPMMPDMMPRVGPGRRPGVFYNTGHGHLGWTLSAATAQRVADAVGQADDAQLLYVGRVLVKLLYLVRVDVLAVRVNDKLFGAADEV